MTQDQPGQPPQIDTSVASIARIYDYWLGGKDNFKADREAAELMIQQYPDIVTGVRKNRAFLGRAVHYLAAEAGIRQFLDIGTGLPSSNNTHEVAQGAARDARIVYVDNDPIVLSHAQALLTSSPRVRATTSTRTSGTRRAFWRPPRACSISPSPSRSC